jgi:EDD domain protein, DegV family
MTEDPSDRLDRTNTAIVTDSTADLPDEVIADPNLTMVPLKLHFGDETFRDWIDIRPAEFYARLRVADRLPTTSQPSAGEFQIEYRRLRERYDHIFSIHLSDRLSGTISSANLAREGFAGITVIDSEMASLAVGLLVYRLLGLLDRGTTREEFLQYIDRYRRTAGRLFLLDTLDYLQKGGRIGKASSVAGSLLHIKPLLTFDEGVVDAYKKVRGARKAMIAMQEYLLERTQPGTPVRVCVAHGGAPGKAEELVALLQTTDRDLDVCLRGEVGAVIGTYAGPGAVALFFIQE